jgi:hypothetical protein
MKIIGCDFHTCYQQIAMLYEANGELMQRRLEHESGETRAPNRDLLFQVRGLGCCFRFKFNLVLL